MEPMSYKDLITRIKNIKSENLGINSKKLYSSYELLWLYMQKQEAHEKRFEAVLATGHHGTEKAGVEALVQFVEENKDNEGLLNTYNFTIFPLINPWGYNFSYYKPDGKNINAEYLYKKTFEARIVSGILLRKRKYDLAIDLHSDKKLDGFFLFIASKLHGRKQRHEFAKEIIHALENQEIKSAKDCIVNKLFEPPDHFDTFLSDMGALSLTFETNDKDHFDTQVAAHKKAIELALENYLKLR